MQSLMCTILHYFFATSSYKAEMQIFNVFLDSEIVEYFANIFAHSNWQCQGVSSNVYPAIFWKKSILHTFLHYKLYTPKVAEFLQMCKFLCRFFPWIPRAFHVIFDIQTSEVGQDRVKMKIRNWDSGLNIHMSMWHNWSMIFVIFAAHTWIQ